MLRSSPQGQVGVRGLFSRSADAASSQLRRSSALQDGVPACDTKTNTKTAQPPVPGQEMDNSKRTVVVTGLSILPLLMPVVAALRVVCHAEQTAG